MSNTNSHLIKRALLTMLRPLVRMLIKHDVSHSEFADIAKEAFVRTAFEDMPLPGRKATVSRVAVLTGLSRKEVARILGTSNAQGLPKLTPNRAARVTTGWLTDPEFCNRAGQPKTLNKTMFDALTQRYSGDITSGAIIDELQRLQIVTIDSRQHYCLNPKGYVVSDTQHAEGFATLAKSLSYLLETGEHNLQTSSQETVATPHFQRQFTEREVTAELADKFQAHASQKSMQLLLELNTWLEKEIAQSLKTNINPEGTTKDFIGLSIFYFESRKQERSHEQRESTTD